MNLNLEINNDIFEKFQKISEDLIRELDNYLNNGDKSFQSKGDLNMTQGKEGEKYKIDEIGDDEKYVFLSREDGSDFQEFNISDELYNKILKNPKIEYLKFENGEYKAD